MLTLTLALLVTPESSAQEEPSPVKQCADARIGEEVEVCLRVAASNPDAVDAIAAALKAHIDRGTNADRELLGALLILLSDETGIRGTELLASLADPRAIQPLVHAAVHRELPVAVAAVAALAVYEEALAPLTRWIREDSVPKEVSLAAAKALGQVQSEEAADALVDTLRRPGIDSDLRRLMKEVVLASYPNRADELDGQVSVNGTPWLTAGSVWALGYSMTAAGHYGQTGFAELGAVTGGVAGGTAGYLYGRAWPVEAGDAAFIATSGFMGTVSGIFIGSGFEAGDQTGHAYLGGLGGEVIGYGLGAALAKKHPGEARDAWEAAAVGALGGVAAGSAAGFAQQGSELRNPRPITPAIGAGIAVGTIAGQIAAPHVDLSGRDGGMILASSAYGLTFGVLVPTGDGFDAGLPSLGLSAGALTGYGLAGLLEPKPDVLAGALTGGAFGGFLGAGVVQMIAPNDIQAVEGSALLGVSAGMAGGGYFSHKNPDPIDDRDVVLTAMTTSWAAWQSTGWAVYAEVPSGPPGALYVIPAAIGATTASLSGELDIPVAHSTAATSLGLWGAYVGGVTAELGQADPLLYSLVGSDIGLVGGSVVMSPLVGTPPLVVGLADAGGVLGGSTGALGAAMATDDSDAILIASLIGSGVGLAGGAVLGGVWHKAGTNRNVAISLPTPKLPGRFSLSPARIQGKEDAVLGVRVRMDQW